MSPETFDLVVIGSGPAGEKGAAQAAYFGKRVAVVEKAPHLGGAGINTGTVPSKTLRETALYFSGLRQRGLYGVDYSIKKDITVPDFMYREAEVVRTLRAIVGGNLDRHQVTVARGTARFEDPHTVRVSRDGAPDRLLEAPVVLVATGSYPSWPEGTPRDSRLFDSDTVLQMDRLPRSLLVVGGGVIGCEYATMFRAMGIAVTLLGGQDRLLPFLDREIGDRWSAQVERLGVRLLLKESVAGLELEG
ncbi:MAG TPA: FAD-dependent oxidoreductase, partial [Vicinamibacteria bacterium]|nr:FAD-dependent oxidoreductase [Vicinamibacteria bacterium]